MKIVSVSWVRNEGDVLESFVRHNARWVDRMIIVVHRSIDASADILQSLKHEGFPLAITEDAGLMHRQGEALTQKMQTAMDADWILPLDADEFLHAPSGQSVRELLSAQSCDTVLKLPWRTYVPTPDDIRAEPCVLRRITHRRSVEQPQFYKVAIPTCVLRKGDKTLPLGSHELLDAQGQPVPAALSDTLCIGHFPVRSPHQLMRKVIGGWLSHRANPAAKPGQIYQWKHLYDQLLEGTMITHADLERVARAYACDAPDAPLVEDPISASFTLHYPHAEPSPLDVLADNEAATTEELQRLRSLFSHVTV
jgi:hypothetical protein